MNKIEPPDLGILKKQNHLQFYIDALRRWTIRTAAFGMDKAIQAGLVLTYASLQYPELGKELCSHFGSELRYKEDGIERLIVWLQSKFAINHHDLEPDPHPQNKSTDEDGDVDPLLFHDYEKVIITKEEMNTDDEMDIEEESYIDDNNTLTNPDIDDKSSLKT